MANFDWNEFAGTVVNAGKDIYGSWTQYDLQRRHAQNLVNNPFSSGGYSLGSGAGGGSLNISGSGLSSSFSGSGSIALLLVALLLLKR